MKKNLIMASVVTFATAAVLATAQSAYAAAGTEKGGKTPEGVRRDVKDSRAEAAKSAGQGADGASTSIIASLKTSKLTNRLDPMQETNLGRAISENPAVEAAAKETIVQAKSERYRDLAEARVGALANLKGIKTGLAAEALANLTADGKKEQTYVTLALNAGKAAESWDAGTTANLTFFLAKINELIASGRTIADAVTEAQALIAKPKEEGGRSVRLNLEEVRNFCK